MRFVVVNLGDSWMCVKEDLAAKLDLEIATEEDYNERPAIIHDRYIDFFSDENAVFLNSREEISRGDVYPDIMDDFRNELSRSCAISECILSEERGTEKMYSMGEKWSSMRTKYIDGRDPVYPDEMIEYIDSFDIHECMAYLCYCCFYKDRFYDGAYADYAEWGYIGKVLKRVKTIKDKEE